MAAEGAPPAWPKSGVEKQLEEEEEEGVRKKERVVEAESEAEEEVDHMGRLPEEVVMVIVNKLFNMKTLIRFSLVAKRYSSLVSLTHSLVVELPVGTTSSRPNAIINKIISAITHRFQQIKHLHLHLPDDNNNNNNNNNPSSSSFATWVTVFGSHLEQFHLLSAASASAFSSVNPTPNPIPNPNTNNTTLASASVNPNPTLNTILASAYALQASLEAAATATEHSLEMLKTVLNIAREKYAIIRALVSECKMIETAVFSDSSGTTALVMGKQQIAKLKQQNMEAAAASSSSSSSAHHNHNHRPQLRVLSYHLPTLDLPKTGYTLNDVTFVGVMSGDHHAGEPVEVMGDCEAEEMANGGHLDDFDFQKLDVYTEAIPLIFNDRVNKVTLYDFLRRYE